MISYEIQFQGELWDIQNSDYQNYFSNKTPFINCSEVELYQYGSATVEVINNEPIIQDFIGEFEFVYQNNSLRFWEIPSGYSNFELICLGLVSIYKSFCKQKEKGLPFQLDTLLANIAIGNTTNL